MTKWCTINRVGKLGLLPGVWLVNPQGDKLATFMDDVMARQIAAAMNITTMKQRTDYLIDGYFGKNVNHDE